MDCFFVAGVIDFAFDILSISITFCIWLIVNCYLLIVILGLVAQLARARHSHCRGQGFDSPRVHQSHVKNYLLF